MKLEAIREDRTRGGRSTYQCTYPMSPPGQNGYVANSTAGSEHSSEQADMMDCEPRSRSPVNVSSHLIDESHPPSSRNTNRNGRSRVEFDSAELDEAPLCFSTKIKTEPTQPPNSPYDADAQVNGYVPKLITEMLSVEHLWHKDRDEEQGTTTATPDHDEMQPNRTLDASSGDFLSNLINTADHRLYKIVKWCKSLPLFSEVIVDDQITLLINSWCELLLLR